MDGYLVFTGNEFGLTLDNEVEFIPLEEAEELYNKYLEEHGCAMMYEFTGYSILFKKSDENF